MSGIEDAYNRMNASQELLKKLDYAGAIREAADMKTEGDDVWFSTNCDFSFTHSMIISFQVALII